MDSLFRIRVLVSGRHGGEETIYLSAANLVEAMDIAEDIFTERYDCLPHHIRVLECMKVSTTVAA